MLAAVALMLPGLPAQATSTSFTLNFTNNSTPDAMGVVAVTFSYSVASQRIENIAVSRSSGVYKNGNSGYPAHVGSYSGAQSGFRAFACPASFTSADLPITDVNAGPVQGPYSSSTTLSAPVGCTQVAFTQVQYSSYDLATMVSAASNPSVSLTNFSAAMSKLVVRAEWFVQQSGTWETLRYAVYGDVATVAVPTAPAITTGNLGSTAVTTSNSASWSFQVDQNSTWRAVIMPSTDTAPTATALIGNTIMTYPPSTNGSAAANTSTLVQFSSLSAGTYKIYIAAYATAGYNSTVLASPAFTITSGGGGGSQVDPACQANGSDATLAQVGVSRTSFAPGETYQTTIGGQTIGAACTITLNSGFWVRTSINNTVVTVSGTAFTTTVRFSSNAPISYNTFLVGLANNGYSAAIQDGDVWKREYFTSTARPIAGDTPIATMTMVLGVSGGGSSPSAVAASPSEYSGPQILSLENPRPVLAGGSLVFTGKGLDTVTMATIGDKSVSLSFDASKGLSIGTPAGLTPGKYDLVMQSSYGKLTVINAVTIKAPTPTVTTAFRGTGSYLNEAQVSELVALNASLNADYEKVRCIVNAADPEVAKAIAIRVCAHVARGEARNVQVIQDVRSTYEGAGFWVRVYAAG